MGAARRESFQARPERTKIRPGYQGGCAYNNALFPQDSYSRVSPDQHKFLTLALWGGCHIGLLALIPSGQERGGRGGRIDWEESWGIQGPLRARDVAITPADWEVHLGGPGTAREQRQQLAPSVERDHANGLDD